ncbi:MAG: L,D-transpeptidase [Polyangiaceae bacterium]|nr:L,D-transpeptidase [Polyangiaceae bacterium]
MQNSAAAALPNSSAVATSLPHVVPASPEPPPAEAEPAPPAPSAPRLHAIRGIPPILQLPNKQTGRYIGYIRVGESVALRQAAVVPGADCAGGYFAIEPRGYVCNDSFVSLAPSSEHTVAMAATAPREGPFPYRYAISNGAPMYNRIPTRSEITRYEHVFGPAGKFEKLSPFLASHEDLAVNEPIPPTDPIPPFLEGGQMIRPGRFGLVRQKIPRGSMLSYTKAFEADGRTYLLSVDLTVVPADRVRPFRPSSFRGIWLEGDETLPIAWFRKRPRMKWRKLSTGAVESMGISFPARSHARLTGQSIDVEGTKYLETKEREGADVVWVAEEDATVVEARTKLPFGVREGQKWIIVRITQGTLVAYEGSKPVYATLISPGAGGVPVAGIDPVKASTTPLGTYNITFKDRAATMSPEMGENRSFWIADVPHTQYFNAPFALHAAYWHERFGEPTSAGCVNLSPIDAEIVFRWSDPPVPLGWQGAVGAGASVNGPTTAVVVAR